MPGIATEDWKASDQKAQGGIIDQPNGYTLNEAWLAQ